MEAIKRIMLAVLVTGFMLGVAGCDREGAENQGVGQQDQSGMQQDQGGMQQDQGQGGMEQGGQQ